MKWELSSEVRAVVIEARDLLNTEVEEMRDRFNNASDKWQNNDKGQEIDAWLETLEELADALHQFDTESESNKE
jgi:hypothetical protein